MTSSSLIQATDMSCPSQNSILGESDKRNAGYGSSIPLADIDPSIAQKFLRSSALVADAQINRVYTLTDIVDVIRIDDEFLKHRNSGTVGMSIGIFNIDAIFPKGETRATADANSCNGDISACVKKIQDLGIFTLMVTHGQTAKHHASSFEISKMQEMNRLGLTAPVSSYFNQTRQVLRTKTCVETPPVVNNGILFISKDSNGRTLSSLFEKNGIRPEQVTTVYFTCDNVEHLGSVKRWADALGIRCVLFEIFTARAKEKSESREDDKKVLSNEFIFLNNEAL